MEPSRSVIIVAGGNGTRMNAPVPKQFLILGDKPVLMHTIEAFHAIPGILIILVLPESSFETWKKLCLDYSFHVKHTLVAGGETRFHSVRNGLACVENNALVAIHDGVRPLVSAKVIGESFQSAKEKGNAVAAVKLKDSIREMSLFGESRNVNRNNYYLIQTPQTFRSDEIKAAYNKTSHYNFTDDASVLEEAGGKVNLIEGDYRNIKITTSEDMIIAQALLSLGK